MGNTQAGAAQQQVKFAPSDGFFLMESAKQGSVEVLRLFLRKDPALVFAHSSGEGSTAWHFAAQEGHVDVLELMAAVTKEAAVSNTFDPLHKVINTANAKGQTALMLAAKGGHYTCVKFLLSKGAGPFAADAQGLNALHYAALGTNPGCTLQLMKGAGLWGHGGPQPPPAGDAALFKFINATDAFGRTPLHYAAWMGALETVVALLSSGANILAKSAYDCYDSSLPCNSGTTPMHLAAMRGHRPVVIAIMAAFLKASQKQRQQLQAGGAGAVAAPGASPSPQALAPDPRTVADAYSNTPFMIASSRSYDDKALLQLLDPKTEVPTLEELRSMDGEAGVQVLGMMRNDGKAGEAGGGAGLEGESSGYESEGSGSEGPRSEASVNFPPVAEGAGAGAQEGAGEGEAGAAGKAEEDGVANGRRRRRKGGRRRRRGSQDGSSVGSTDTHMLGEFFGFGAAAAAARPRQPPHQHRDENGGEHVGGHVREVQEALQRAAELQAHPEAQQHHHPHHAGEGGEGSAGPEGAGEAPARPSPGLLTTELGKVHKAPAEHGPALHGDTAVGGKSPGQACHQAVPDCFLCPLTLKVLKNPVVAADGITYEEDAITKHFASGTRNSPLTRAKMPHDSCTLVFPNRALKQAIEFWAATNNVEELLA